MCRELCHRLPSQEALSTTTLYIPSWGCLQRLCEEVPRAETLGFFARIRLWLTALIEVSAPPVVSGHTSASSAPRLGRSPPKRPCGLWGHLGCDWHKGI